MRHASAALQRAALCGLLLALSAQAARLGESLGMTAEAVKHRVRFRARVRARPLHPADRARADLV